MNTTELKDLLRHAVQYYEGVSGSYYERRDLKESLEVGVVAEELQSHWDALDRMSNLTNKEWSISEIRQLMPGLNLESLIKLRMLDLLETQKSLDSLFKVKDELSRQLDILKIWKREEIRNHT